LARDLVQTTPAEPARGGLRRGIGDTLRNWPLVLRSLAIGSVLGAVPGIGVTVIEWVAYGEAARRPGKGPAFGKGNIRGVIAPESANNSKKGGALLPKLAFGIPGSAVMAALLGAFTVHGLQPGPDLVDKETPLLVTMILSIARANIRGALICLGLTRQLSRLALVRSTTLVPRALCFLALGAFHTSKHPLDLVFLLVFGALGLAKKRRG
jgi:putative tricarboxylic transport membrane protein